MDALTPLTAAEIENFRVIDEEGSPDLLNECVGGEVLVRGPLDGCGSRIWSAICRQLVIRSAERVLVSARSGLRTAHGFFIPDMSIFERDVLEGRPSWGSPDGIAMLAEIVGSCRDTDRVYKRHAFAAAEIPLYLLVDRETRESVLFSQPDAEAQDYRADLRVPFGSDLELPAPFSCALTDFTPSGE